MWIKERMDWRRVREGGVQEWDGGRRLLCLVCLCGYVGSDSRLQVTG